MGLAAMMSASTTTDMSQMNDASKPFMRSSFVGGSNFGFRIPMNIPNQRQRRRNERRNPSLRNKRK